MASGLPGTLGSEVYSKPNGQEQSLAAPARRDASGWKLLLRTGLLRSERESFRVDLIQKFSVIRMKSSTDYDLYVKYDLLTATQVLGGSMRGLD